MRAGGGASPRPSPLATLLAPAPTSSATIAMPPPRLAHLRRLLLSLRSAPPPHRPAPTPGRPLPLLRPSLSPSLLLLPRAMTGVAHAGVATTWSAEYEEVLGCLASLITQKVRADTGNRGHMWELMAKYVQILELEESIEQLKVVHVAGTKGKGSTCAFAESILRSCGFRTGLFTSPHLMDVRERFRLDGMDISEEKFIRYFWWCWNKLKDKTRDDIFQCHPTLGFLALLAFKIFSDEQVKAPVVCGITSLGYDHMEILGNALGEIAGEKAGILKKGVPAFTVPQPEEAMSVLIRRASELGGTLPDQFIEGLSSAFLQGRAQIVPDPQVISENDKDSSSNLVFYLDGAHSPESMEMCARWFTQVTNSGGNEPDFLGQPHAGRNVRKILLFNCMSVRDPQRLLPRLLDTCAQNGLHFEQALFVPNQSQYNKLGSLASPPSKREQIDLSWQLTLQRLWESLPHSNQGLNGANSNRTSLVFESLPLAMKWLRDTAQQNQSTQLQVKVLYMLQFQ
ncbi:hypothetical protein PR202_gb07117 [Eleusine coracana subsp. coracana]|uniref:Folylpolyglutamate synthase n=1 Tax=Eleusine coracana subsp. coracana TaxID=191504 RepID=A0AAV5EB95_ELECO|nr:hypothetical protein PR202_gb07117 [Eleusine coracana subsp. coracana]